MCRALLCSVLVSVGCLAACVGGETRSTGSTPTAKTPSSDTQSKESPSVAISEEPRTAPSPPPPPPPPKPNPLEHGISGLLQAVQATRWKSAVDVEAAWNALKSLPQEAQGPILDSLARGKLEETACEGLVDFRALNQATLPPFGYRDTTRDRGWIRPTVARILIEGYLRLRKEFPDARLSVGDLSQAGCGQLSHGSLIRYISDAEAKHLVNGPSSRSNHGAATQLINASPIQWGTIAAQDLVIARDLGVESTRLETPEEHVLVEHHVLSQGVSVSGARYLKVATRRFRPLLITDGASADAMLVELRNIRKHGTLISSERVLDWRGEPSKRLWSHHWIDTKRKRQFRVLSSVRLDRRDRSFKIKSLVEVQAARWQAKKPKSYPGLVRWFPTVSNVTDELEWSGWRQLYEAGHQTHLAGRDADLSYVTHNNKGHFAIDLAGIDLEKSWRWFEILDETSRELGARVDRILVDPTVWRLIKAKFKKTKKKSRVWRLLRRVGGHNAHHHVRIAIPAARLDREANTYLREFMTTPSDVFGPHEATETQR